jgi:hypothetical protein
MQQADQEGRSQQLERKRAGTHSGGPPFFIPC